ncbi:6-bladed beta-propeller [Gemmatimonadota bacterium]
MPFFALVLSCALLVTACSNESPEISGHSFRAFQENGITNAENEGGPKYGGELFSFDRICTVLEEERNPESLLYWPDDGMAGPDGEIVINDRGNNRVVIFNPDGSFRTSFGRKGNGPGEFQNRRLLWVRGDTIAVFDWMLSRTSLFTMDGALLKVITPFRRSGILHDLYALSENTQLRIERRETRTGEERFRSEVAVIYSTTEDTLGIVASKPHSNGWPFHSAGITGISRLVFGPASDIDVHPEYGLLTWSSDEPIIRWHSWDGHVTRIIRLDFPVEPVTDADRTNHHEYWQGMIRAQDEERQRQFYREWEQQERFPEHKSLWSSLMVDDAGYLWFRDHYDYTGPPRVFESGAYKVCSPEGEYLGDVTRPGPRGWIQNGYYLARVENQETELAEYTLYRITPNVRGLEYP